MRKLVAVLAVLAAVVAVPAVVAWLLVRLEQPQPAEAFTSPRGDSAMALLALHTQSGHYTLRNSWHSVCSRAYARVAVNALEGVDLSFKACCPQIGGKYSNSHHPALLKRLPVRLYGSDVLRDPSD